MASAKIRRRRSNLWKWALIVVIGVALGIVGTKGWMLLNTTQTSFKDILSPPFDGKKFVRILMIGEDNTAKGSRNGRGLSDTLVVAAIDLDTKTVRAVSVPRDTMVHIPGHGLQKINAAYVFGGAEQAVSSVQLLLGVPIDYYMHTDISKLKYVVDLVGGVGIDIEKNMRYTDRRGHLYINLKKGYRHLDGEQALGYVRFRHDPYGDISYITENGKKIAVGRVVRQQKFLRALAKELLAPNNWARVDSIIATIYEKQYITTTLNLKDFKALAEMARDIPPEQMEMAAVPGAPKMVDGQSFWVADPEATSEVVQQMLFPSPVETDQSTDAPMAKIAVLNGSGTAGLAKVVTEQLERAGFTVTTTGNADRFNYTDSEIIVHTASVTGAEQIARAIGSTNIRTDTSANNSGADITVIVGRNYRH